MLIINRALISTLFDIYITIQILRQEATEISMYSFMGKVLIHWKDTDIILFKNLIRKLQIKVNIRKLQ